MRKLYEWEQKQIDKLVGVGGRHVIKKERVKYVVNGNFTCAAFSARNEDGSALPLSLGTAKRNPSDEYDRRIGERVALRRAVENLLDFLDGENLAGCESGVETGVGKWGRAGVLWHCGCPEGMGRHFANVPLCIWCEYERPE